MLVTAGFAESARRPAIHLVDDLQRGIFCREAQLDGAKCDVPVRLTDGRLLAIECKVSNSATNSVKRLLRETGGKARAWRTAFGQQVTNLLEAQDDYGIAIFWKHDLDTLMQFLRVTTAEIS